MSLGVPENPIEPGRQTMDLLRSSSISVPFWYTEASMCKQQLGVWFAVLGRYAPPGTRKPTCFEWMEMSDFHPFLK